MVTILTAQSAHRVTLNHQYEATVFEVHPANLVVG